MALEALRYASFDPDQVGGDASVEAGGTRIAKPKEGWAEALEWLERQRRMNIYDAAEEPPWQLASMSRLPPIDEDSATIDLSGLSGPGYMMPRHLQDQLADQLGYVSAATISTPKWWEFWKEPKLEVDTDAAARYTEEYYRPEINRMARTGYALTTPVSRQNSADVLARRGVGALSNRGVGAVTGRGLLDSLRRYY